MSQPARHQVSEQEARKVAEASRETEWRSPSFLRELFLGRSRLDLVDRLLGSATVTEHRAIVATTAERARVVETFVAAFDTLFGGFRQRADKTFALLQADGTAFVVVAAPEPDALDQTMLGSFGSGVAKPLSPPPTACQSPRAMPPP